MLRKVLVTIVCFGIFATGEYNHFKVLRNRETSTEPSEELPTAGHATANDRIPAGYFIANNVPKVEEGCSVKFECKKKLKNAETPKPCLKFCAKTIECENGKKFVAPSGQCVELNEAMVIQEYNDCKNEGDTTKYSARIMPVALIDFPCQPGYLPDSRGRCREVW